LQDHESLPPGEIPVSGAAPMAAKPGASPLRPQIVPRLAPDDQESKTRLLQALRSAEPRAPTLKPRLTQ
jgi:hypothetical protein